MLQHAALSHVGRRRQTNQDCFLVNADCYLYLIADGLGGHAAGTLAAKLTATSIADFVELVSASAAVSWPFGYSLQFPFEHNVLRTAVLLANLKVCQEAEAREGCSGMGSTVVGIWARNHSAFWTHLGDSRIYLLRGGELRQLSEDHSLVQEQLKRGIITPAEVRTHSLRNVVTRAVGSRGPLEVDVHELSLQDGDLFLLCCDGLSDKVSHSEIHQLLTGDRTLEATAQSLIDAANQAGGEDNITVILLRYLD
jgi:PPM family protein phosphatase